MPIAWEFVKDVPYTNFEHIEHAHSGQALVNMWHGMHFPYDTGRKVVETYAESPHITNVIAWRRDPSSNTCKAITEDPHMDPWLKNAITPNKRVEAPAQRLMIGSGRAGPNPDHNRPLSTNQRVQQHDYQGTASPSPKPGQMVMARCIIDEHGNYVPVTPRHEPSQQHLIQNKPLFDHGRGRGHAWEAQSRGMPVANRGGRGGMHSPLRGAHSFHNMRNIHMQHPVEEALSPVVQHMHSTMNMEDPFADPGNLVSPQMTSHLMHQRPMMQVPGPGTTAYTSGKGNQHMTLSDEDRAELKKEDDRRYNQIMRKRIEDDAWITRKGFELGKYGSGVEGPSEDYDEHEEHVTRPGLRRGDSFLGDIDWEVSSEWEKRNISPVRGSDGEVLESASKAASPKTKKAMCSANRKERYIATGVPPSQASDEAGGIEL